MSEDIAMQFKSGNLFLRNYYRVVYCCNFW